MSFFLFNYYYSFFCENHFSLFKNFVQMINFKLRIPLFDRTESVQFIILGSFSGEAKLNYCNSEYVFSGPMGILKNKVLNFVS